MRNRNESIKELIELIKPIVGADVASLVELKIIQIVHEAVMDNMEEIKKILEIKPKVETKKSKRICPICFESFTDEANMTSIEFANECLQCDHLQGEKLD